MSNIVPYQELFDKIENYYTNNSKLSDKELIIAERWELAFALLLQHRSKKIAASKLSKIKNISIPQAYRDLKSAERIFAPIKKYSTEFLKLVLLESAFNDVKQAEKRARKAESTKEWVSLMEIKNKAEYRIIQVSGVNNIDSSLPDFSKLKPANYNIVIPEELTNLFLTLSKKGVVDVTELVKNNVVEATYKEINEDE